MQSLSTHSVKRLHLSDSNPLTTKCRKIALMGFEHQCAYKNIANHTHIEDVAHAVLAPPSQHKLIVPRANPFGALSKQSLPMNSGFELFKCNLLALALNEFESLKLNCE